MYDFLISYYETFVQSNLHCVFFVQFQNLLLRIELKIFCLILKTLMRLENQSRMYIKSKITNENVFIYSSKCLKTVSKSHRMAVNEPNVEFLLTTFLGLISKTTDVLCLFDVFFRYFKIRF